MVNALTLSAAVVGASLATLAQGAALRQSPLFGCVSYVNGTIGLGLPDATGAVDGEPIPANFVAGHTQKSLVTGKFDNSVLDTARPRGADLVAGDFEFLNCTQSLLDRGYKLDIPRNFARLSTDDLQYDYTFGLLRNQKSRLHALSTRIPADSKGRIDGSRLLSTKYIDTPVEDRTFIAASADEGATVFIEFYPFFGEGNATKSAVVYTDSNVYGSVELATNHIAHAGSSFITLVAEAPEEEEVPEE